MSNPASLPPGFRFHPTDEELILHYLKNRASSSPCPVPIIAEVDIYKHNPWDLPAKAAYGDREWYFFSPRDRKYPNGFRPNRSAASGYWKATGTDKPIRTSKGRENIGVKKALVFYKGRPPKGMKTNWIMHEYRLAEAHSSNSYKPIMKLSDSSMRLDDWVLCRIYKKKSHLQPLSTPLMDHEQVGSGLDDIYSSSSKNLEQQSTLRLQKSSSISDLLENYSAVSHLFESENGTSLMAQQPHCAAQLLACNSSRINGNNSLVQQQTQTKPSFLTAESSMERQRMMEHCFDGSNWFLHPSTRHNSNLLANSSEQLVDGNLLEQQYLFDQQLLLNSHLGLH